MDCRGFTCDAVAGLISVCMLVSTAAAAPPPEQRLGTVVFPTSCSVDAQPALERGLALLHSFQYQEAADQFEEAARRDTSCAMCHWGKAMTLYRPLWDWPSSQQIRQGRQEVARARKLAAPTERERDYIDATAAFFDPPSTAARVARVRAYSRRLAVLHRRFPDDIEAAALYGLSLVALAIADGDRPSTYEQAMAVLEPLFQAHPDHPGAAHYLIHAADRPGAAARGLDAARRYAEIAPASSHALHMPSHIFVRLGMWDDTIAANLRAAQAGKEAARQQKGDYTYQIHALDYVHYAYLQRGMDREAAALLDELNDVPTAPDDEKIADRSDYEIQAAVESHRWRDAAEMPIPNLRASWLRNVYWARTIGAARVGDARRARQNLRLLRVRTRALQARAGADAQSIPLLQAEGWVAFAEGRSAAAVRLLRRAADREGAGGGDEVAMPSREMLADLLLLLNRPDDALVEYRATLQMAPNRFNALFGAAGAAEALGRSAEAREFYGKLISVAAPDATRPDVAIARSYLSR